MKWKDAVEESHKKWEEYNEKTIGDMDIELSDEFFTDDKETPAIEVTIELKDGTIARGLISVDELMDKVTEFHTKVRRIQYPKWLDERPAHMMTDGNLLVVRQVRFHPEYGMFAIVKIYDSNMCQTGEKIVEITGLTDRKALARKLANAKDYEDVKNEEWAGGYVTWHGNSLEESYPELVKEWDYEKNTITPKEVRPGTSYVVWWKCENGHEWTASVSSRVRFNTTCPICKRMKKEVKE